MSYSPWGHKELDMTKQLHFLCHSQKVWVRCTADKKDLGNEPTTIYHCGPLLLPPRSACFLFKLTLSKQSLSKILVTYTFQEHLLEEELCGHH